MRDETDEDGIQAEAHQILSEIQMDVDKLNRLVTGDNHVSEEIRKRVGALADKIDGLADLARWL